ncbi:MAG: ChaN family lipoprotein [Chitinophagales bacterium]|nr:ChaN family lipoprotein [Chitinophagales bacterium]
MKYIILITILFIHTNSIAQKPAYTLHTSKGKKTSYSRMLKDLRQADIILFGELHNNPIAHWLQQEVTKDLAETNKLVMGAEMIEADNQEALNMYLSGELDAKGLDTAARLWPNYKTDYKPLIDFAKREQTLFIATNIPRRYAQLVYKKDFESLDSLSAEEKSWIAPLPILFDPNLPKYKEILTMMGDHGSPKLVKAQAIKDATMAHFILANFKDDSIFIHYNGAYHSDHYEGILWYLRNKQPDLNYITISTVEQENNRSLDEENVNLADYIICVDADMTKTY